MLKCRTSSLMNPCVTDLVFAFLNKLSNISIEFFYFEATYCGTLTPCLEATANRTACCFMALFFKD